jgi:hypothetical protein
MTDNKNFEDFTETITLTFGDVAENHKGMQQIGNLSQNGFKLEDLQRVQKYFYDMKVNTTLYKLNIDEIKDAEDAYILIIKSGLQSLTNIHKFYEEQKDLNWDSKAKMYGRVVNKTARHNLCFSDFSQTADYENSKGTIVDINTTQMLKDVKNKLESILGECGIGLQVEGNRYYDVKKCGIGFHGDTERKKVLGIRLGADFSLVYRWFQNSMPVGEPIKFTLCNGDIYLMSEKAVGSDWKKRSIPTLRHAAGDKFAVVKKKE